MGDGEGGADDAQAGGDLAGAAVEQQRRPSTRLANHLDFEPAHTMTDSGAEGFGARFLCGKARGEALCRLAFTVAVGLFRGGIDTVEKANAVALDGLLDASNLRQIDS